MYPHQHQPEDSDRDWWQRDIDDPEAYKCALSHVETLIQDSTAELEQVQAHEWLYEGEYLDTYSGALDLAKTGGFVAADLNVTRALVDTFTSKFGRNAAVVKVNPFGTDNRLRNRAIRLGDFLRAEFDDFDSHFLGTEATRDACVAALGICGTTYEFDRIVNERVLREEIFFDPRDARMRTPRQLHRVRQIAKERLKELMQDRIDDSDERANAVAIIDDVPRAEEMFYWDGLADGRHDIVHLYESWHLPSGPEADDGRWICYTKAGQVCASEWNRDSFPFAFLPYKWRRKGMHPTSLVGQVEKIQLKINQMLAAIQRAVHYGSELIVFKRASENIAIQKLGKRYSPSMIEYTTSPPEFVMPKVIDQGLFGHLQWLIDQAYQITGVNQLATAAKNPLGANASGVALQELEDQQSNRHAEFEGAQSLFRLRVARNMIAAAKEMHEGRPDVKVSWKNRGSIHAIRWSELDMEQDDYRLSLQPGSFLPESRSGKLDLIDKLGQNPSVFPSEFIGGLIEAPDTRDAVILTQGPIKEIRSVIDIIQNTDKPIGLAARKIHRSMNTSLARRLIAAHMANDNGEGDEGLGSDVFERYLKVLEKIAEIEDELAKEAAKKQAIANAEVQAAAQTSAAAGPAEPALPGGAEVPPGGPLVV